MSPPTILHCHKTSDTDLTYGMSQFMRMTDGRTDISWLYHACMAAVR